MSGGVVVGRGGAYALSRKCMRVGYVSWRILGARPITKLAGATYVSLLMSAVQQV